MSIYSLLIIAFILGVIGVYTVRWFNLRYGYIAKPTEDRWHRFETPTMGGVGIYAAVVASILIYSSISGEWGEIRWGILLGGSILFFGGVWDDIRPLSPQAKLVIQFLAASVIITMGYTTFFFTPRLENNLLAQIPNIILTYVWLIGITNAINLLDNMDGLAGGVAIIAALILSYFYWNSDDFSMLPISIALVGSLAGFLVFNFPPAKIFMGDSGSLFLGFTLAVLAIARQPQASNVLAVLGVPTLLFLLPIVDTALVMVTRILRGQSPVQGGRDHTSHRLIAFGFSERQAVMVLYGVAIISGIVAVILESLNYDLSLVLIPLLIISLALFTAYLGRIKVLSSNQVTHGKLFMRIMLDLVFKRRILEVVLDFFLIGVAYYLAFWTRFVLVIIEKNLDIFLATLPIALVSAYFSFLISGVYRDAWQHFGLENLLVYIKAAIGSALLSSLTLMVLYSKDIFFIGINILYAIFLIVGLIITRSSFVILDMVSGKNIQNGEEKVLIIGTGEMGEIALRWIYLNSSLGYKPIGFVESDSLNQGRQIHGIRIVGGLDHLEKNIKNYQIVGVILTIPDLENLRVQQILDICQQNQCWVKVLTVEFSEINMEN